MSLVVARKKRTALYLSIAGLLAMVAAISAVSARDADGVSLRVGMIMLMVGSALWLPWQALLPAAVLIWFGPNYARVLVEDETLFSSNMLLELPGMLGLAAFAGLARQALKRLEDEDILLGATNDEFSGVDPDTGVYDERLMRPAIEAELARARRFDRQFALVLVGIDELRQRFDYRDQVTWNDSFAATASLLRSTRMHIDRAYRYGSNSFALILPESGEREVTGLIRRLRRVARRAQPAEGEPGGPLPTHFGATFFPNCATTTEDLLRRAEIALRLAEKSSSRVQLDSAEAPDMPAPETLRRTQEEASDGFEAAKAEAPEAPATLPVLHLQSTVPAEPQAAEEPVPYKMQPAAAAPIPLYGPVSPALVPPAMVDEGEAEEDEPDEQPELIHAPEYTPFTVVQQLPAPEELPAVEELAAPLPHVEAEQPEPTPISAMAAVSEPVTAEQPAPAGDDSLDDLMKHLDETLAMIRSLRTGSA